MNKIMPQSVSRKVKADENKANKIIQLEVREAKVVFWSDVLDTDILMEAAKWRLFIFSKIEQILATVKSGGPGQLKLLEPNRKVHFNIKSTNLRLIGGISNFNHMLGFSCRVASLKTFQHGFYIIG